MMNSDIFGDDSIMEILSDSFEFDFGFEGEISDVERDVSSDNPSDILDQKVTCEKSQENCTHYDVRKTCGKYQ